METKHPSVSIKRAKSAGDESGEVRRGGDYCLVGDNTEKIEIFLCSPVMPGWAPQANVHVGIRISRGEGIKTPNIFTMGFYPEKEEVVASCFEGKDATVLTPDPILKDALDRGEAHLLYSFYCNKDQAKNLNTFTCDGKVVDELTLHPWWRDLR
jgi:hypothetical protein